MMRLEWQGATSIPPTRSASKSVTDPLPPLGSITLTVERRWVLCGEVTMGGGHQRPTPRASCVAGHAREAVSHSHALRASAWRLSQISGIFSA